jgi:hypothetical protein
VTTFHLEGREYVVLETAEQADKLVSDETIQDALEGWFGDRRTVPEEEFIDCISDRYGTPNLGETGFEIQQYDSPAARRILSRARRIKREL